MSRDDMSDGGGGKLPFRPGAAADARPTKPTPSVNPLELHLQDSGNKSKFMLVNHKYTIFHIDNAASTVQYSKIHMTAPIRATLANLKQHVDVKFNSDDGHQVHIEKSTDPDIMIGNPYDTKLNDVYDHETAVFAQYGCIKAGASKCQTNGIGTGDDVQFWTYQLVTLVHSMGPMTKISKVYIDSQSVLVICLHGKPSNWAKHNEMQAAIGE